MGLDALLTGIDLGLVTYFRWRISWYGKVVLVVGNIGHIVVGMFLQGDRSKGQFV